MPALPVVTKARIPATTIAMTPGVPAKVAAAVAAARPAFSVFLGDMVASGNVDDQWDQMHFGPAKEYFATIPYYPVIGNHERNCSLFLRLFQTPSGDKNWAQRIGPMLLIGIDGGMNWEAGGELATWLEAQLAAGSDAKFIFLATHYPAWSSGSHAKLGEDGAPRETPARLAQQVIMPLLAKYGATAMLAGHDHFYERSEPPEGVTMIVSGGAGVRLRDKWADAETQNPHSKAFAKRYHYCVFTIEGDTCTMQAVTPDGEVLDERTWPARGSAEAEEL